jgi:GT2 family glycosyltransferase
MLRRCITSILERTGYRRFEIIVMDNGSVEASVLAYLAELMKQDGVTVIRHDAPFNFSQLNNIGARTASGDLLVFLNDDTEILQRDWLERLGGFAQLAHVGAVGAKLLYPGGDLVQHVGVLNLEGGPVHALKSSHRDDPGYFMRNLVEQNWLAVTGACLMVGRRKYDAVGCFSESLPVAYNDIDLCLRLRDAGYYNVVVPAVSIIHYESATRGLDHVDSEKAARLKRDLAHMYERSPRYVGYDPFHNPGFRPQ